MSQVKIARRIAKPKLAPPPTVRPLVVTRKYGEPKFVEKVTEARALILADLNDIQEQYERILTAADKARIENARTNVAASLTDAVTFPWTFEVLVDEYSGLRYQVEVATR